VVVTIFTIAGEPIEERFLAINMTSEIIRDFKLRVEEALAGQGAEVAHTR
jgi:hypothetical protein